MSRIHRAGRICGGIIMTVGVIGVLGVAGGSDNSTMKFQSIVLSLIACLAIVGLGVLIYFLNCPQAVRRRATYRFRRDIDLVDYRTTKKIYEQRHGDWWDQIPVRRGPQALRPLR